MTPRVLVVGGGLTSAVTSCLLREELQSRCQLAIWDKARGAGGRLSTSRGPEGCGNADLGAQYVTVSPHYQQRHQRFYSELTGAGVLAPLSAIVQGLRVLAPLSATVQGLRPSPAGTRHLVASDGSSALVRHFLRRATAEPEFGQHVTEVSPGDSTVSVVTAAGRQEAFDVVVLTMPTPQILGLGGSLLKGSDADEDSVVAGLRGVEYSSRYALGLFFDKPGAVDVPWGATYVSDHPVIRYVAVDNVKRGKDTAPTSVVVHTSVAFGVEHVEKTPDQVQPILLRHVTELFPDWPVPVTIKCQKWRFSQVVTPYPGSPGHVVLCRRPLVVAAGDAFTHSNVDGCIESAESTAQGVIQYVKSLHS
ncbi:renalase-like [Pollicipes pollicipes]|uniref:renalase-like n=1 Tax=Pollicipes pollicipes TaxID=41117 RepID=UPI001884B749|nr:renalase-like [Pollicipes pollicipes]